MSCNIVFKMFSFTLIVYIVAVLCISNRLVVADEVAEPEEHLQQSHLLKSAVEGDADGVASALAAGEDIDTVNTNGWSAAMFAVVNGNIEMLDFLIENRIDLNNADNDGVSPLMRAALVVSELIVIIVTAIFVSRSYTIP